MKDFKNCVQLVGHLGKDPELRTLPNGAKMVKISIATNRNYKNDKGEYVEQTHWHNLIGWGYVAERMAKQMKRGAEAMVQGSLEQRSYEDKNGIKRYVSEVRVSEFLMMDKAHRTSGAVEKASV